MLVVDDQAPFRLAARAVLRRLDGFEFAGEAKNGREAVGLVETLKPALILMDIHMPEMNGIEATRRIVALDPQVTVILCSTHDPKDLPADAATSGAVSGQSANTSAVQASMSRFNQAARSSCFKLQKNAACFCTRPGKRPIGKTPTIFRACS